VNGSPIFDSEPISNDPKSPVIEVRYYQGKPGRQTHLKFEKISFSPPSILARTKLVHKDHIEMIAVCMLSLGNTQHLDPSPAILRSYSQAHTARRMGERGENFAALVKTIITNVTEKSAFVSWLKELTPAELDDVSILSGALGESLFALKEGDIDYPAPILSDGTLRFAAITAAFFQPDLPQLLTLEEIENGLHPTRLRLLVELMKAMSKSGNVQVMATTHSPLILEWLNPDDYATTFVCKRDESTGATNIIPLSEIPALLKLIQKQPISELFAEGWFEGVL
jgi:predicted ATPase